jgi:hypothetical protein
MAKKKNTMTVFGRDEHGLLSDTVDYVFTDEGLIDWRKMIDPKQLYPKPDKKDEDPSKLKDFDLLSTLAGFKKLAQIRGYRSVDYKLECPNSSFVTSVCTITWMPNYETEMQEVKFSATASAGVYNTDGMMSSYLAECAENRSFARCIRSFLKIGIVAKEEMFKKASQEETSSAPEKYQDPLYSKLRKIMEQKGTSLGSLKQGCDNKPEEFADIDTSLWKVIEDIPKPTVLTILGMIKSSESS